MARSFASKKDTVPAHGDNIEFQRLNEDYETYAKLFLILAGTLCIPEFDRTFCLEIGQNPRTGTLPSLPHSNKRAKNRE
jgi:hypothetical protein